MRQPFARRRDRIRIRLLLRRQDLRCWLKDLVLKNRRPLDRARFHALPDVQLRVLEATVNEPAPWQTGEVAYRYELERRQKEGGYRRGPDWLADHLWCLGLLEKHIDSQYREPVYTALHRELILAERERRLLAAEREKKARLRAPRVRPSALV